MGFHSHSWHDSFWVVTCSIQTIKILVPKKLDYIKVGKCVSHIKIKPWVVFSSPPETWPIETSIHKASTVWSVNNCSYLLGRIQIPEFSRFISFFQEDFTAPQKANLYYHWYKGPSKPKIKMGQVKQKELQTLKIASCKLHLCVFFPQQNSICGDRLCIYAGPQMLVQMKHGSRNSHLLMHWLLVVYTT